MAELLERGHTVWALYRHEFRKVETIRFLSSAGLPRSADTLRWLKGNVLNASAKWPEWTRLHPDLVDIDTLLHNAASTRLHLDEFGEPVKTNVGGAAELKKLVEAQPMAVHLVSTAYVCGLVKNSTVYEVNHPKRSFVNVYEESKWQAEQLWAGHATILRPGIIVGHSETARCTSFTGWYILAQALSLMDRLADNSRSLNRNDLRINIPARPDGTANIIPVDYVAKASVRIMEDPDSRGKIFHLTHPDPPTHQWTLDYLCRKFRFGGIHLTGDSAPLTRPRNRIEQMVLRQLDAIQQHFSNSPDFDRSNTERAAGDLKVPPITEQFADRLIDYAVEADWGQSG